MRWALVVGSIGLAGCLATPPSGLAGDPDGGADGDIDAGQVVSGTLALTGIASRDPLTLDMRDELVIVARDGTDPVAVILYPGAVGLEDVTAIAVPLPVEPLEVTVSRWGATTGLAVALGADGQLTGIDKGGSVIALRLAEDGEQISLPLQHLAEVNLGGRRLTLSDGEAFYVTDPLGTGQLGEEPIEVYRLGDAVGPVLVKSSFGGGTGAVGVVEKDQEIDVYPVTAAEEPAIGPDRVAGDLAPDPLLRASWQMSVTGSMVLVGIDPAAPGLWYHSTSMEEGAITTGTVLDGAFDVIHDLVLTRLDGGVAELALLAEEGGQLEVVVYLDPGVTPEALPAALVLPISGLSPPYWVQAMDAVFDSDDPGENELVVYDEAGHLACIDLVNDKLASCGSLDLSELLKATGASTSGRPGW